jgi:hypothetical protein
MTARAQEIRTGLAWLHSADPVLAQLIDDRPDFDPGLWMRRLPAMDLFGALVFQIIGQQISVIAATAIFARLTERFGGRVPDAGELAAVDQGKLRGLGLPWRKAATVLDLAARFSDGRLSEAELRELPDHEVIRRLTEVKGSARGPCRARFSSLGSGPMSSAPTTWPCGARSRRATASITSRTRPRWQTSPSAGGRTGASPPACCWPPRDLADPAGRGLAPPIRTG